jgi:hypothetical protein
MDFLRDPIWQFIGVVVAIAAIAIPYIQLRRKRKKEDHSHRTKEGPPSVNSLQTEKVISTQYYSKHKGRKPDGILVANISSDFLNQFPASIEVRGKHLDRIYTPENFGASNWLDVFRRFTKEEYFTTTKKISLKRMSYDTLLNPGPKLYPHLEGAKRIRRSIIGVDNEVSSDE